MFFIGCLLGSLIGCLLGSLLGFLIGCQMGSLLGCLIGCQMGCLYVFQIWPSIWVIGDKKIEHNALAFYLFFMGVYILF